MKNLLGMRADEIGKVFEEWNKGELSSFLIEITGDILQQKDPAGEGFLVDKIMDAAGQKGTGQWTAANALELGSPANAIAAAVFARALSTVKDERVEASKILKGPEIKLESDRKKLIESIRNALYCSKICAYAQGFQLIDKAQVPITGNSTLVRLRRSGVVVASYARASCRRLPMLTPWTHA